VVKIESVNRSRENAQHWVVFSKQGALAVLLRKELKLIWATFGSSGRNINMVCSYGREHKDPGSKEVKWVHVLNLAFRIRESHRK
jgi:hypothetical protein